MCKIYDDFNVTRCYKCCDCGHTSKNCKQPETCHLCSYSHSKENKCKSKNLICINCLESNKNKGTKFNVNHAASDIKYCKVYRIHKYLSIKKTDYTQGPMFS